LRDKWPLYFGMLQSVDNMISPLENIPPTSVNSVKKTVGFPYRAITCLSTVSVTSSIGARIKMGFSNVCQKFFKVV
jgi:hypothetical protein